MTPDMQNKMAKLIADEILTPVIYMIENDGVLGFICFCDRNISMHDIYRVEQTILNETGQSAEIIDIREFSESERLEIINKATLIHSEHPMLEQIFTQSMVEDFKAVVAERKEILDRIKETGTFYIQ